MEAFQTAKQFLMDHFSAITLSVGLLLLVTNTSEMSGHRNSKDPKDKTNGHFNLNVYALVSLTLFVLHEYAWEFFMNKSSTPAFPVSRPF